MPRRATPSAELVHRFAYVLKPTGTAIRARRQALAMTQSQLAERASIKREYVSEIENGARNPTLIVLTKIAEALGCKPSELLDDAGF